LTYRTLEEREAYMKELEAVMAARRSEQNRAAQAAQVASRSRCETPNTKTHAEKLQEARNEAEAIRVANGGAPAQQRTYNAPAVVEAPTFDKERDNLILLIMNKLQPLSTADLNEVNGLIDALTYPLRKQSQGWPTQN
jgi:hypothetical protein